MYIETNANPNKNIKAKDHIINAICNATGISWEVVFDDLCKIAKRLHRMPHENGVYLSYLRRLGFKKSKTYKGPKDKKLYTVEEFCKEKPVGTFIIKIRTRLTCVKDGNLIDNYDCSKNKVFVYWYKVT